MKSEDRIAAADAPLDAGGKITSFPGREAKMPAAAPSGDVDGAHPPVDFSRTVPDVTAEKPAAAAPAKQKRGIRSAILPIIGLAVLSGAGWYGYDYWTDGRFMINTDDAYLQTDISDVSPKVQGYVEEILVSENQQVKAGDLLFRLDDGDYTIAIDNARAKIEAQKQTLNRISAQTDAAATAVGQAEANRKAAAAALRNAELGYGRARDLLKTNVVAQSKVDDAQAALDQAQAGLAGADAQIASAEANVAVLKAEYAEAESQVRSLELALSQAERNLSFTLLKAPLDGVVGNVAVHHGDLVSPGQQLAAVVPLSRLYVMANFKETQLGEIVAGEDVRIHVDALPDREFHGTVASVAPASGAVFSLLPPENATGNFTKVVQRVPVRIDLPADVLATGKLRAGMSVVVDIDSRTAPAAN
ncbi:membrane fusion protein (multidrug efflux system) [Hoeflea marina]|uniref:Membrane fusion protein (Multidrug efflux system) n=1 Tax=Hoeflea marina TaxID=274592 RepID=A0A317PQC8_9HYPH|nr:HlyD family secretion protein [Hoeflea marina]PWW02158.1 membrane fusion protein (multidrug efflux system) [Hoeflea marina]